jgi:hypothetical protein
MPSNFLSIPLRLSIFLIGIPQQLSKLSNPVIHLLNNVTLLPVHSISFKFKSHFYSKFTFSKQIPAVSESCIYHIRYLRGIRNTIDQAAACTLATSFIHFKLNFGNSLRLNLPST